MDLKGRIALVTGASKGLGRNIAAGLAGAGATVCLVARNSDALRSCATEIRDAGGTAEAFTADVTDERQVAELCCAVLERFGAIHILVNNAGVNLRKPVVDFTLEEWNRLLSTNLTSVFLMCRAFVPQMKGLGYGRIINLTSMMSHVALPERTAYSATKSGLLGFTRALALELAADGITVNGISPGPCATEMNRPLLENPELSRFFLSRIPVGRWGRPEEISALAVYLCGEAAAFITGTDIVIDGGWTTQ
jgi:NAD(P)-dependent dehydrogenase (short-subunit alcohol dehydrogenase family)